jgi:hypothetical protein
MPCNFSCTHVLDPQDPLFDDIGTAFVRVQTSAVQQTPTAVQGYMKLMTKCEGSTLRPSASLLILYRVPAISASVPVAE